MNNKKFIKISTGCCIPNLEREARKYDQGCKMAELYLECYILKRIFKWVWRHTLLIPGWAKTVGSLWIPGHLGLLNRFQDSQSCTVILCLNKSKTNNGNKTVKRKYSGGLDPVVSAQWWVTSEMLQIFNDSQENVLVLVFFLLIQLPILVLFFLHWLWTRCVLKFKPSVWKCVCVARFQRTKEMSL